VYAILLVLWLRHSGGGTIDPAYAATSALVACAANIAMVWMLRCCPKWTNLAAAISLIDVLGGLYVMCLLAIAVFPEDPSQLAQIAIPAFAGLSLLWGLYNRPDTGPTGNGDSRPLRRKAFAALGILMLQHVAPSTLVVMLLNWMWDDPRVPFTGVPVHLFMLATLPLYYAPLWLKIAAGRETSAVGSAMAANNPPTIDDLLQDHGERYHDARSAIARAVLRWERPIYERHLLWRLPEKEAVHAAHRLFQLAWEDPKRPRWGEVPEESLNELVERPLRDWIQASRLGEAVEDEEADLAPAPKLLTDLALATLPEERAALLRDCLARTDETNGDRKPLTDEQFRMLREAADSALTELAHHFPMPAKTASAASVAEDAASGEVPDSEAVEAGAASDPAEPHASASGSSDSSDRSDESDTSDD
jgi:hypothetical protein